MISMKATPGEPLSPELTVVARLLTLVDALEKKGQRLIAIGVILGMITTFEDIPEDDKSVLATAIIKLGKEEVASRVGAVTNEVLPVFELVGIGKEEIISLLKSRKEAEEKAAAEAAGSTVSKH
jgi:hypothetical protein